MISSCIETSIEFSLADFTDLADRHDLHESGVLVIVDVAVNVVRDQPFGRLESTPMTIETINAREERRGLPAWHDTH